MLAAMPADTRFIIFAIRAIYAVLMMPPPAAAIRRAPDIAARVALLQRRRIHSACDAIMLTLPAYDLYASAFFDRRDTRFAHDVALPRATSLRFSPLFVIADARMMRHAICRC